MMLASTINAVTTGLAVLRAKVSIPSDLRTRQWAALPVWIRERSFFMAGVERAEILDGFRSVTDRFVAGELGQAEARNELRTLLDRVNYQPLPGQEGTIKDLRTLRRMNVVLETNQLAVNGFARWARQQAALGGFPAQRLVRVRRAELPRFDWDQRWQAAHAASGMPEGATGPTERIALLNHPLWQALGNGAGGFTDTLGNPYPPFAWGSGMGVEPVDRAEAEALGLIPGPKAAPEHRAMLEPQDRGLNAALEAHPKIRSQKIRDELAEKLQGLAEWKGDRLLFTDPNGTRATTAEELAAVWKRGLPGELPLLQKQAVVDWVSDHESFLDKNHTDRWTDLQRLHARLVNTATPATLWRGMSMSTERLNGFLHDLEAVGFVARTELPGESFTISAAAAANYARTGGQGWSVILEVLNPSGEAFKDLSPFVRAFAAQIRKQSYAPVVTEAEWLLKPGVVFRMKKIDTDAATRTMRITLQEEPR